MARPTAAIDLERTALLLVDLQPDFMPGGALAVADADRILEPVCALMNAGRFRHLAATQDWHPRGHLSFASSHPGHRPFETIDLGGRMQTLWPDHCIQGSAGASLHAGLPWERVAVIVRKGMQHDTDSYSGFRNNIDPSGERPSTGLAGYLKDRGVDTVFCCGLARDFCVKWTAEDAVQGGFSSYFIWDLTRPVDPGSDARVRSELEQRGVKILESNSL